MRKPTSSTQLAAFLFVDSWWHEPHNDVQCRAHGSTFEFLFEFQQNFSGIFCSSFKLFEHQTSRLSRVHCIYKSITFYIPAKWAHCFLHPSNEVYKHWAQIFHSTQQNAVNERQVCEYTLVTRHSLNWKQHSLCWNPKCLSAGHSYSRC
jgi:hypothetical protein